MNDPTDENHTHGLLDEDARQLLVDILADGRALFGAQIEVSHQTLCCRWTPETIAAYDRLDEAWEAALAGLAQDSAALDLVKAVYDAANAFAPCREREGFSDGYLCGRMGLTPRMGHRLVDVLGRAWVASGSPQPPR